VGRLPRGKRCPYQSSDVAGVTGVISRENPPKKHQPGQPYQIRLPAKYNGKTVKVILWQVDCSCGEYTTAPYPWPEMALRAAQRHVDEQTLPPRVYEAERRREDRHTGSLACPAHIPCGHSLVDHSDGRWRQDGTPVNPKCTKCDCEGK
jgi:hypothetical protein